MSKGEKTTEREPIEHICSYCQTQAYVVGEDKNKECRWCNHMTMSPGGPDLRVSLVKECKDASMHLRDAGILGELAKVLEDNNIDTIEALRDKLVKANGG